jgi:hypothetical protein
MGRDAVTAVLGQGDRELQRTVDREAERPGPVQPKIGGPARRHDGDPLLAGVVDVVGVADGQLAAAVAQPCVDLAAQATVPLPDIGDPGVPDQRGRPPQWHAGPVVAGWRDPRAELPTQVTGVAGLGGGINASLR